MDAPGTGAFTVTPYGTDCPNRPILDQIVDSWSTMVMAVLGERPRRSAGIERSGMMERLVLPTVLVGGEYLSTPLGDQYGKPLADWTVALRRHSPAPARLRPTYLGCGSKPMAW